MPRRDHELVYFVPAGAAREGSRMAKRFADVMEWYLSSLGMFGASVADRKVKGSAAVLLEKELGQKLLSKGHPRRGEALDKMEVIAFKCRMRQQGYKDSTIRKYLSLGSCAIKAAVEYKRWDLPNPFEDAGNGLKVVKKDREITGQEERLILIGMRQPCRDMAELILETGMRPGEVRHLTWDRVQGQDLLFRQGMLTSEGGQKNREPAVIHLSERARELIARQPREGKHVFTRRGAKISQQAFLAEWHRSRKQAKVPLCTVHDCRRTWGKRTRRAGLSLDDIQRQMRHKSQAVTESVYASIDMVPTDAIRMAVKQAL